VRTFRAFSIRAKLIAIVMITTAAAMFLVAVALAVFDVVTHKQTLKKELGTIAQIVGENSTAALVFDSASDADKVLAALASQPEMVSGCLYDHRGTLFAKFLRPGAACPRQPEPELSGFTGNHLVLFHAILSNGEPTGTLRLEASLAQLQQRMRLFALVLVLVLAGAALVALGLSSRLQRLVSRPILELAGTARQISAGRDYALRAPQHAEDEIGVAVEAFNQMLQRIQDSDQALRSLNATLEERVAERTAAADERAEALKRSNEELERFAYVASHDLKEPLRAVASYAQLVQQRVRGQLGQDVDLYVDHILGGASRMRGLIGDLLDYSRVGRQAPTLAPVPVEEVLAAVLTDLATIIAESEAQVTHGPLPVVFADRGQVAQLLQNLIANAIRFRGPAAPAVHLEAERAGERWRFSVRDNGIGIEPRHYERIFVIFQRLHGRDRPGTGIGLAICRKIVDGHGGTIWVESEPGHGSTFYFTLPAEPPPAPAPR
jgi:signal transduction histidine kinase